MPKALIDIPRRLGRFRKPKRFKILIGGRGSAKSETVAAMFAAMVYQSGCRAVCCREFQTSIKQSVHSLMKRKIVDLGLDGFDIKDSEIVHNGGGHIIYQGLSRDPEAIKSIDQARLCWVEEAQTLSNESLEQLTPSIRAPGSELWFTANLGSSADPFSRKFIKPFERELRTNGYYEDDLHMIVWINYQDNPWFPDELDKERILDKERLTTAEYDHKWLGQYNDTVENSIILADWFDATIDAHKKLGFEPRGFEVVAHDPSDTGEDAKGLAYRHGVVFKDIQEMQSGDINAGGDWAADYTQKVRPDAFVWDGDGMGIGLRRQFGDAFRGKKIQLEIFRGSHEPDRPEDIYGDPSDRNRKTNKQTFKNKRAQCYWELRERFRKTYLAVEKKKYINPDELMSISSDIKGIDLLRAEVCRVPLRHNGTGVIQIMSKQEMRKIGIDSPNMADSMMMAWGVAPEHRGSSNADLTPEEVPDY